ncbi:MAG: response regulator transcription factor [Thermoleophilia bacterium]|nr:response regulator transcription factor [Thermoleophilia bacterium]
MKRIAVLIVDDHTLIRDGIQALLALVADVDVVGEAANGREALAKVRELLPDVVLMDLAMPVMSGFEAIRRIRREFPATKVIALSQYNDSEYVMPAIEAGACGFVTKMAAFSELAAAIHEAQRGDAYLSPSAATALVERCREKSLSDESEDSYGRLTDREREVLKLVAEGHTVREIADMLVLSTKTVDWCKTSFMRKLAIHNKTELIKYAIRKRVISL